MTPLKKIFTPFLIFLSALNCSHIFANDPPNILFIIGDDMGVDALAGFDIGTHLPSTPNLDKLRNSGVTFTNVWSAPVCAATRASLISGKYGTHNGVNTIPGVLGTEHKSIFTEIREQSNGLYKSCVAGKWHISGPNDFNHPYDHGVDDFMGILKAGVEDYYKWVKVENGTPDTCHEYVSTYFTDYATNWIKQQTQPWFMWLSHVSPHAPFHVPPPEMYTLNGLDANARKYMAMIESLDYEIGRLLDSIPDNVLENTVVIFLGDNGTPGRFIEGFPTGRGKQTIYQGGINVPLIISGKGVSRVDEKEDALINVSDFYVTLAQIINPEAFPSGNIFDSYSFKHLLDSSSATKRVYNYMELGANNKIPYDMYTTRDAQYKLLDLGNGSYEFYDLSIDTFELNKLLDGDLSEQQANAKEVLFNEMNAIRGFISEPNTPAESPQGKALKYPVVHTGVEEFYDTDQIISTPEPSNVLFWQDAGRIHNSPSYTDIDYNSITDNITGLMWQKDMGEKLSYAEATVKADNLSLGGYTDWRIPTIKELYSLIRFNGHVMGSTAIAPFIDIDYFNQPLGDVSIGERTIDAQTWSSTHYTGLTMNADTTVFGVNFIDGRIKGYPKYNPRTSAPNKMYFRMVRGNTDYGKNLFTDNGNGTVTDSATMLMWQQADDGTARDWLSSIQYCEELMLAGYDDWHLPNAKELQSLVDYYRSPVATNSAAIDTIFKISEITDPDGNDGHYPYFWSTSTHQDGPNPYNGAVYVAFGKALGKMNEILMDVHGAGAQRSDPKTGNPSDYPQYHGPQGDLQMVYNHCRCVRNLNTSQTAIEETKEWDIKLYPNPIKSELSLKLSTADYSTVNVKLYDIHNKLYIDKHLTGTITTLDVSLLREGVYVLVCTSGSAKPFIEKIIKL